MQLALAQTPNLYSIPAKMLNVVGKYNTLDNDLLCKPKWNFVVGAGSNEYNPVTVNVKSIEQGHISSK